MPEDMDEDLDFDEDDDDEPLPVLTPEGLPVPGALESNKQRRKRVKRQATEPGSVAPKGNTKIGDARVKRGTTISEAQGRATFTEPGAADENDWRDDMAVGERGKAASKLSSGRLTHNSGSGFGLA